MYSACVCGWERKKDTTWESSWREDRHHLIRHPSFRSCFAFLLSLIWEVMLAVKSVPSPQWLLIMVLVSDYENEARTRLPFGHWLAARLRGLSTMCGSCFYEEVVKSLMKFHPLHHIILFISDVA